MCTWKKILRKPYKLEIGSLSCFGLSTLRKDVSQQGQRRTTFTLVIASEDARQPPFLFVSRRCTMASCSDTDRCGQQGFCYTPLKSLSPDVLSQHRQPLRWWPDGAEAICGATHTACLHPIGPNPVADLREAMRHLQFKSICLLVHDRQDDPLLYVHCMSPINEVLDAVFLEKVKVRRQHVLFFTLQAPYNLADVQAAFNLWVTRRQGLNAAAVHSPSDLLVVFANESPVEQLPECFQVALAFMGNVCPLVEMRSSESVSVWVSGTWASIQELNNITRALVDLEEPGVVGIEVDEGWSQLRIQPRRAVDVVRVRDAATNALRGLGHKSAIKCNRIVLYQCAVPLSPFECEVDLSTTSHRLLAFVDAAHAALTSNKEDTFGEVFAHDAVMRVLSELQCDAIPRHNYKYSFDMHGMKCVECVRLILDEFVLDRPGHVGYTSIALSPTRNLLAVTAPAEQRHNVQRHVQDCLTALGMSCALIGQGPDLKAVDDPQALALYSTLTKKMRPRPGPATNAVGVCLRPDAVRCSSCAALLRSTLLRVVPGILHVALDCALARMTVHYVASEVTENEILAMLRGVGYQPTTFSVPLSAPTQPCITPFSPSSAATTQYCSGGSLAPPSAQGGFNPYATMGPSPTQQHRSIGSSYLHSPYAAMQRVQEHSAGQVFLPRACRVG